MWHLDFLCLALIEFSRDRFLQGDDLECLQIAMKPLDLESADEIIELAERIKKIMNPQSLPMPLLVERELASTHEDSLLGSFNHDEECSFAFDKEESSSPLPVSSYNLKTPEQLDFGDPVHLARSSFRAVFMSSQKQPLTTEDFETAASTQQRDLSSHRETPVKPLETAERLKQKRELRQVARHLQALKGHSKH